MLLRWPKFFLRNCYINPFSSIGRNVKIGYGTNINGACFISKDSDCKCVIGRYCAIAHNFRVRLSNHQTSFLNLQYTLQGRVSNVKLRETKGDVIIGDNVWIGDNVVILPGVRVGDGAVIGACSVITKDVEPYSINVGIPSKLIRYRFPKKIVDKLLKLQLFQLNEVELKEFDYLFSLDFKEKPEEFEKALFEVKK